MPLEIILKTTTKYMLTVNVNTMDGLVNGATAQLMEIGNAHLNLVMLRCYGCSFLIRQYAPKHVLREDIHQIRTGLRWNVLLNLINSKTMTRLILRDYNSLWCPRKQLPSTRARERLIRKLRFIYHLNAILNCKDHCSMWLVVGPLLQLDCI